MHWNGGYDSVSAFLKYCELKGYRTPETDCYGWARLCQVVGNFFGGTTSIGIDAVNKLDCDNWDNGVYIIKGWKIVDRKYKRNAEQIEYDLEEMLLEIDNRMPKEEQIGEYIKAKEIPTKDLKVGDTVFINTYDGKFEKHHVMGFGGKNLVNGMNVNDLPYVDLYGDYFNLDKNINNYICKDVVKVVEQVVEAE